MKFTHTPRQYDSPMPVHITHNSVGSVHANHPQGRPHLYFGTCVLAHKKFATRRRTDSVRASTATSTQVWHERNRNTTPSVGLLCPVESRAATVTSH